MDVLCDVLGDAAGERGAHAGEAAGSNHDETRRVTVGVVDDGLADRAVGAQQMGRGVEAGGAG